MSHAATVTASVIHASKQPAWQRTAFIIILLLAALVLWPQRQALIESFIALRQASPSAVGLALLSTASTYTLATALYLILVKHPVRWRDMWLVQLATALTSRLAPIGIGTMGLTAYFLIRRRHTTPEALAVVITNNSIGIVGHIILLAVVLPTASRPQGLSLHANIVIAYMLLAVLATGILGTYVSPTLRQRLRSGLRAFVRAISSYNRQPRRLVYAIGVSMSLSLAYVWIMAFCCQALNLNLPFGTILLIYTFSLITGILTPTPGGLFGVEAGIVAGFIAFGIDARTSLSIALLYRLVSYWIPLVPGFIALRLFQRQLS